jgi:HK97 gp10 family phage protein
VKIQTTLTLNLKTKEAKDKVGKAYSKSLKEVVVLIGNDVIKGSPVLTGNNRRSIEYESDDITGQINSTSGYGGYIETGTSKMEAQPYFRPALDRHIDKLPKGMKAYL